MEQSTTKKVLVVDDHPIVRQGLAQLIEGEADLVVCAEAANADEAQAALQTARPDVIVIDLSLGSSDGLELLRGIRSQTFTTPVLVLSVHDEGLFAERTLSAGANGYIMKRASGAQVIEALRRVLEGGVYVSDEVGASMIARFSGAGPMVSGDPVECLSNRELQILKLIGQGRATREIASSLNLSVKTIESHRQRIKKKLDIGSSVKLIQYAVTWATSLH